MVTKNILTQVRANSIILWQKKLLTVGNFDSPVRELQFSIEITDTTIRVPAAKKLMTMS